MKISLGYKRRGIQKIIDKEIKNYRFAVLVLHRRAGKTVLAINHLIGKALSCKRERPMC